MAFEGVLAAERSAPKRWLRLMVAISLGIHVAALTVGVAYSFWRIDEVPMPAIAVTLVGGAPPAAPPPPAKRHTPPKPRPHLDKARQLVQPTEQTQKRKDDEGGRDDGVEGGVSGGEASAVPTAAPTAAPKMLQAQNARALLLINPNVDPYVVRLPPALARANATFSADVYICVSAEGHVTSVRLVRGADPAIDSQIPTVLGRWRYRPYMIDGKPVPFCWPLRYQIATR
jgi:hypothetical protein